MEKELVIERIKRVGARRFKGAKFKIVEYANYFSLVSDNAEPSLFEKEDGFPVHITFAQLSVREIINPKVVFESGGKDNGEK